MTPKYILETTVSGHGVKGTVRDRRATAHEIVSLMLASIDSTPSLEDRRLSEFKAATLQNAAESHCNADMPFYFRMLAGSGVIYTYSLHPLREGNAMLATLKD